MVRIPESAGERPSDSEKTYAFPANDRKLEAIRLVSDQSDGQVTLVTTIAGEEHRIECGRGKWKMGKVTWGNQLSQSAAASGAWNNETFIAKLCFVETPFIHTISLKFAGHELTLSSESNVSFGATRQMELVGKAK